MQHTAWKNARGNLVVESVSKIQKTLVEIPVSSVAWVRCRQSEGTLSTDLPWVQVSPGHSTQTFTCDSWEAALALHAQIVDLTEMALDAWVPAEEAQVGTFSEPTATVLDIDGLPDGWMVTSHPYLGYVANWKGGEVYSSLTLDRLRERIGNSGFTEVPRG